MTAAVRYAPGPPSALGYEEVPDPQPRPSNIASLANRGRSVMVGDAGREANEIDPRTLMHGSNWLTGVFLGGEIGTPRVRSMIAGLVDEAAPGPLQAVRDRTFTIAEAAEADANIGSRQAVGRVAILPCGAGEPGGRS